MDIEQVIRDYLPDVIHMSLATVKNNKPWVCEVHFSYDDDLNLYFRSLTSRRHSQEIAENPHVAGNIVRQFEIGATPKGVYFEGTAKLLEPGDELDQAFTAINARYNSGEKILEDANHPDGAHFYKITVDTYYVFGTLGDNDLRKYELAWKKSTN